MRPVIGILGSVNTEKAFYFANQNYWEAVRDAGGLPVLLPYVRSEEEAAEALRLVDGLLLAGGDDINPSAYGEEKLPECGSSSADRDLSERSYISVWDKTRLPCLGICRGLQALNVFLGGSLWQDIPSQVPGAKPHANNASHRLNVADHPLFCSLCGEEHPLVNSFHHQAVRVCAPSVIPVAFAEDGIVEAVAFARHPNALAVQFHPERTVAEQPLSRALFAWLVKEASQSTTHRLSPDGL